VVPLALAGLLVMALLPFAAGPAIAQQPSGQPAACPSPAPPSSAPPTPLSMPEEYRLGILDQVWQQLRDEYLDGTMHGLDWDAIHSELEARMLVTLDAREAYQAIAEMVARLEDPDTFFVSVLDLEASALDPTYGGVGILVDSTSIADPSGGLRVVYVFPGGPALAAGIQPRDTILAVGGDPCARPELIRGPVGTSVELLVRSPGEEPRTVRVERQRIAPAYEVVPERVPGRPRYGYLRLVSLAGDAAAQVEAALTRLLDEGELEGLVLDLRHASAGELEVTRDVLGDFVGGELGTLLAREGDTPFVVQAGPLRDRLRDVPLAVLVDTATDGEAERLAGVLQAERDAVVIGQQTAGHTQLVSQTPLPEGSLLQLVVGGMLLSDGTRLEGRGVLPDVEREDDWMTQPQDDDAWIEAAIGELRRTSQGTSAPE
jgi:C-terminal peptidase prc